MEVSLLKEFRNRFHKDAEHVFFCPGRVNLIGEHIDYNGGMVMPAAIAAGTYLLIAGNNNQQFLFQALDFPEQAIFPIQFPYTKSGTAWYNYPIGIINQLLQDGHPITGLDMLFHGNLPVGAGLSSSASIEVLTGYALATLFHLPHSLTDLALMGKKVENEFIGMNCGIMDQFAVAMGKKDKAILLQCDTLKYEYLPFETGSYILTIINSNKQRRLTDSKYNERFAECRSALQILKNHEGLHELRNLCDLNMKSFESLRKSISDPVLEKRAHHVISENERVGEAAKALKAGQLIEFGQLMYASHRSLRDLYEVSGPELDAIIEYCEEDEHCIGARMTGAGFGGCAIALVQKEMLDHFTSGLINHYIKKTGYAPTVFDSAPGDGVREEEFLSKGSLGDKSVFQF